MLAVLMTAGCVEERLMVQFPTPPPSPDEHALRPIPPSGEHIVQPGETLSGIAGLYGLNSTKLARANEIADRDTIYAGSVLALRWSASDVAARLAAQPEAEPGPLRVVIAPPESDVPTELLVVRPRDMDSLDQMAQHLGPVEPEAGEEVPQPVWDGGLE